MSIPSLNLFTDFTYEIDEIYESLLPGKTGGEYEGDSYIGSVGKTDIFILDPNGYDFGDYKEQWKMLVNFRPGKDWGPINQILLLNLFSDLFAKYRGGYLCSYDTGFVLFYFHNGKLQVAEAYEQYFSKYPFDLDAFGRLEYANLEAL